MRTWSSGEPHGRLLRTLDAQRGVAGGLMSSVESTYTRQQALLDISQGSRQSGSLYSGNAPALHAVRDGAGATIDGWDTARLRARDVSVTLRPGTLAGAVPGGAGYVGVTGSDEVAIAAADEHGRVAAFSTGPAATIDARVAGMLDARRLVVVELPGGDAGRAALLGLLAGRGPDELVVVAHLPPTPPEQGFGRAPTRFYRLPAFAVAARSRRRVRSTALPATTAPSALAPPAAPGSCRPSTSCPRCSITSTSRFPTPFGARPCAWRQACLRIAWRRSVSGGTTCGQDASRRR